MMRAGPTRARARAKSPVPQQRSRTRAPGRPRIDLNCHAVRARQRRSNCNDKRWFSKSYRGAICVNISRTLCEASASVTAPSGRVPLTGTAASAMASSQKIATRCDEARGEMENALDNVKRDGVVRARFADAGRKDEAKNSGARFLVGAHGAEQCRGRNARPGRQWPQAANERDDTGNFVRARQSEFVSEKGGRNHAPRHGFAVLIAPVFRYAFEGMGEGMAVVEYFPEAGFAFVAAHHAGFDLYVAGNQETERVAISPQHFLHVLLKHREHLRVRDNGVLDDLRESAAEFTIGKRAQQFRIGKHQQGRVERADQVLPLRKIDAGLAADGAVHLGDERRRDVHKFHTAQEYSGGEARHITDDAAANRDHE